MEIHQPLTIKDIPFRNLFSHCNKLVQILNAAFEREGIVVRDSKIIATDSQIGAYSWLELGWRVQGQD